MRPILRLFTLLITLVAFTPYDLHAQTDPRYYDIGTPVLTDIWVDPVNGNDANTGSARAQALRTVAAAWNLIPSGATLSGSGRRIMLTAGNYPESSLPNYLEQRYGTAAFPVIFQSADGRGAAVLQGDLNIFDCRYLYLIDLTIRPAPAGDTLHFEQCNHILMRGLELDGGRWISEGQTTAVAHETLKINQCQYVYIEDCNIHGADDNAVDFVAVQYGHVVGNRIHNANDWAMYAKGGSAYLRIEANEIYDAGTGGFTAGQGTGFEFMTSPWLHYEAYDIKVVNNIIHDTEGAGLGVNGGYNILMAWNTLYRVGRRSHLIEVVHGSRSCDGDTTRCQANQTLGGWGGAGLDGQYLPSRNVYIYNNIIYNPAGYQSQWQHFEIRGPVTPPAGSNVPSPSLVDVNLRIRGNVIWNGPADHSLGLGSSTGCAAGNATCNETQLLADNAINTVEPQLINPAAGNYRPQAGSNILGVTSYLPGNFGWSDAPTPPTAPAGNSNNVIGRDRDNTERTGAGPAGAWLVAAGSLAAPGNLTATVASSSQINLSWTDTNSSEAGYRVFRRLTSGATFVAIADLSPNVTSYQNTGLSAGASYTFAVAAFDNSGQTAQSSNIEASTQSDQTLAPTNVTATAVSATQINLSWTDAATNETGYRIQRRLTSGTVWTTVANLAINAASYQNSGLTAATGYTYRVSAIAPGGAVISGADVAATTFAVTAAPTGVTATAISTGQINLKWNDVATNETGYQVERRLTSATVWGTPSPLAAGVTTFSDTSGLAASTSYTYRVSAIAPGGALVSAAPVSATTSGPTAVPTTVTATAFSSAQINLSWRDAATNETGYRIQRRLTSDTSDTALSIVANLAANVTSYQNTGLTASTGYSYVVSAIAPGGALVSAAEVAATTYAPTEAPTSVVATPFSATRIDLSWTDTATNETGYRIQRRLTSGTVWTTVVNLAINATSYQNSGLTAATGYTYRVSAIAPGGAVISAAEVAATTFAVTAAPTGVTATTISIGQINLKWNDVATNETGYQVERRLTTATVWGAPTPLAAGVTTFSDTSGLAASTSYTYRVSAIAPGGALVSAAPVAARTSGPTAVPNTITATAFSSTQINLRWNDAAINETGYRIERRLTSDTSDTALSTLANLAANITSYQNTGLAPSTGYTYVVSAIAPGGAPVSAAEVAATTYAPTDAPTGVTATPFSATRIDLSWTDLATNETGYRIQRRLTTGTTWTLVTNLGPGVTAFQNSGLTAATAYTYLISAIAPGGALVSAAAVEVTTLPVTAAPTGVTARAFSSSQINLSWTDAATNETGYRINRRLTSGTGWTLVETLPANTTSYQNTGLNASTGYTYQVSAIAPGGTLASAAAVAATTFGPTTIPTGVTATAFSSTQVNLKWTDTATNETGYKIERRLITDTAWDDVVTLPANANAYNNTGLTASTSYTYRVSAVAPGGALASAATVNVTTFAPTAAPTGVAATPFSASRVDLSWTDAATNETGYRIQRRLTSGTVWTLVANLAANVTSYQNTGLTTATGYTYLVSAIAPGGALVSADEVSVVTP
jgi:fibronectin type 3 domain-containing protein